MNRSDAIFDTEAFLMCFEERLEILEGYLDTLPRRGVSVERPLESWENLKEHLDTCPAEEHRIIVSGFREVFELCSDEGHERLLQVLKLARQTAPTLLNLPVECLALKVLIEDRSLFEAALSLDQVLKSDSLELFKPISGITLVSNVKLAVGHFRSEMARICGGKYGSQRILIKHYNAPETLTIGFYFEKQPKAQRQLDGAETSPRLKRDEIRPIQLDFVIYEKATGVLSIKSGWGRLTEDIRQAFAAAFLSDPSAYEWEGSRNILELGIFTDLADSTISDAGAVVREVLYNFKNDSLDAQYRVNSADVCESLGRDQHGLRIQEANIRRVSILLPIPGKAKKRRVVLQVPNRIEYKRTSGAIEILRQLQEWHVFNAPIAS